MDAAEIRAVMIIAEIRARINIAVEADDMRQFIKEYLIYNKHNNEKFSRFVWIIRNEYPSYKDFLENVLILI